MFAHSPFKSNGASGTSPSRIRHNNPHKVSLTDKNQPTSKHTRKSRSPPQTQRLLDTSKISTISQVKTTKSLRPLPQTACYHYSDSLYMGQMRNYKRNGHGMVLHDNGFSGIIDSGNNRFKGHNIFIGENSILSVVDRRNHKRQKVYRSGKDILVLNYLIKEGNRESLQSPGYLLEFERNLVFELRFYAGGKDTRLKEKTTLSIQNSESILQKQDFSRIMAPEHIKALDLRKFEFPTKNIKTFQSPSLKSADKNIISDEIHIGYASVVQPGEFASVYTTEIGSLKKYQPDGVGIVLEVYDEKLDPYIWQFSVKQRGYYQKLSAQVQQSMTKSQQTSCRNVKMEHFGQQRMPDSNNYYFGHMKQGKMHGKGLLVYGDDKLFNEGEFKNGQVLKLQAPVQFSSLKGKKQLAMAKRKIHSQDMQLWIDQLMEQVPSEYQLMEKLQQCKQFAPTFDEQSAIEHSRAHSQVLQRVVDDFKKGGSSQSMLGSRLQQGQGQGQRLGSRAGLKRMPHASHNYHQRQSQPQPQSPKQKHQYKHHHKQQQQQQQFQQAYNNRRLTFGMQASGGVDHHPSSGPSQIATYRQPQNSNKSGKSRYSNLNNSKYQAQQQPLINPHDTIIQKVQSHEHIATLPYNYQQQNGSLYHKFSDSERAQDSEDARVVENGQYEDYQQQQSQSQDHIDQRSQYSSNDRRNKPPQIVYTKPSNEMHTYNHHHRDRDLLQPPKTSRQQIEGHDDYDHDRDERYSGFLGTGAATGNQQKRTTTMSRQNKSIISNNTNNNNNGVAYTGQFRKSQFHVQSVASSNRVKVANVQKNSRSNPRQSPQKSRSRSNRHDGRQDSGQGAKSYVVGRTSNAMNSSNIRSSYPDGKSFTGGISSNNGSVYNRKQTPMPTHIAFNNDDKFSNYQSISAAGQRIQQQSRQNSRQKSNVSNVNNNKSHISNQNSHITNQRQDHSNPKSNLSKSNPKSNHSNPKSSHSNPKSNHSNHKSIHSNPKSSHSNPKSNHSNPKQNLSNHSKQNLKQSSKILHPQQQEEQGSSFLQQRQANTPFRTGKYNSGGSSGRAGGKYTYLENSQLNETQLRGLDKDDEQNNRLINDSYKASKVSATPRQSFDPYRKSHIVRNIAIQQKSPSPSPQMIRSSNKPNDYTPIDRIVQGSSQPSQYFSPNRNRNRQQRKLQQIHHQQRLWQVPSAYDILQRVQYDPINIISSSGRSRNSKYTSSGISGGSGATSIGSMNYSQDPLISLLAENNLRYLQAVAQAHRLSSLSKSKQKRFNQYDHYTHKRHFKYDAADDQGQGVRVGRSRSRERNDDGQHKNTIVKMNGDIYPSSSKKSPTKYQNQPQLYQPQKKPLQFQSSSPSRKQVAYTSERNDDDGMHKNTVVKMNSDIYPSSSIKSPTKYQNQAQLYQPQKKPLQFQSSSPSRKQAAYMPASENIYSSSSPSRGQKTREGYNRQEKPQPVKSYNAVQPQSPQQHYNSSYEQSIPIDQLGKLSNSLSKKKQNRPSSPKKHRFDTNYDGMGKGYRNQYGKDLRSTVIKNNVAVRQSENGRSEKISAKGSGSGTGLGSGYGSYHSRGYY